MSSRHSDTVRDGATMTGGSYRRPVSAGYARYVGRVGALAVALGIGAAITAVPQLGLSVASAQTGADSTGSSQSDPASSPASSAGTSTATQQQASASASSPSTSSDNTSASNETVAEQTSDSLSHDTDDADGADTSDGGDETEPDIDTSPSDPTATDPSPSDTNQNTPAPLTDSGDTTTSADNAYDTEPPGDVAQPTQGNAPAQPLPDNTSVPTDAPITIAAVLPSTAAPQTNSTTALASQSDTGLRPVSVPTVAPRDALQLAMATSSLLPSDRSVETWPGALSIDNPAEAVSATPAAAAALLSTPQEPARRPGTAASVARTVVTALIAPFIAPGPSAPVESPMMWAMLGWLRRESQRNTSRRPATVTPQGTTELVDPLGQSPTVFAPLAATAPTALATPADAPPPEFPPVALPDSYATLADLTAQPSYIRTTAVFASPYLTSSDGPTQITPPVDSGSGIVVYHYTVTRPADDPNRDILYVATELADYNQYGAPIDPKNIPILSLQRLDPGQSISVEERIVENFYYPPDGAPRETLTDQHTYGVILSFTEDPFINGDQQPPTPPTITSTGRTDTTVDLVVSGGTDNVGIIAYEIFQNGAKVAVVSVAPGAVATYTDRGLQPDTPYTYTARALDADGLESQDSAELHIAAAAPDTTAPTAPSITTTDRTDTSVDLLVSGGDDNVGIIAYEIFRNGSLIGEVTPGESYTDTGLEPGITNIYWARARDAAGNESPDSAPPLVVTTNVDGPGCEANQSCEPPNMRTEHWWENFTDSVDAFTVILTAANPALGLAFDLTVGTVVGLSSFTIDGIQFVAAFYRGDFVDSDDELHDLLDDLAGLIPGASIIHGGLVLRGQDWPWD